MQSFADNDYLESIVCEVKKKLPDYLGRMGRTIERNGSFRCILSHNHEHNDDSFSAVMNEDSNGTFVWFCHSCKIGGTIYDAIAELEGIPVTGRHFITTTIDMAEQFGIAVDINKMYTEQDETFKIQIDNTTIMNEIERIIYKEGNGIEHLTSGEFGRKYSKEEAEKILAILPIGIMPTSILTPILIDRFGEEMMSNIPFYNISTHLLDSYIFSEDSLVSAIRGSNKKPCGFMGRKSDKFLNSNTEGKKPKYKFTKEAISNLDALFFGSSRKDIKNSSFAYIAEGLYDVITMYMKGITNVIPLLGSNFDESVAIILSDLGVGDIIIVSDKDNAGIKVVRDALLVSMRYGFSVRAVDLSDKTDPDTYLRKHSKLPEPIDAITFVLKYDSYINPKDIPDGIKYQRMIDFVSANSKLKVRIREYSKCISDITSYHADDVFDDILAYKGGEDVKSAKEMKIWNRLYGAKDLSVSDKIVAVDETRDRLVKLLNLENDEIYNHTWGTFVSLLKQEIELPPVLKMGFETIDSVAEIEAGTLSIWSAFPSNCKSSFLRACLCNMFRTNPNLYALYVSTDDPPITAMVHMIAILTGMHKNDIKSYIRTKDLANRPEMIAHMDEIKDIFSNKLCLVGLEECRSIKDIQKKVTVLRKKYNKDFIVVVDAMNNLDDLRGPDQRIAIESTIGAFKSMAVHHGAAVSVVSHMTKQDGMEGNRPSLRKLKGSSYIEFEAKNVFLLHMDMKYNEETNISWRSPLGEKLPVVEINIAKDKDNKANKNIIIPFLLNPYTGEMIEPRDDSESIRLQSSIKESINPKSKTEKGEWNDTVWY